MWFADDFVVSFQYKRDAEKFDRNLRNRFARFHLALADDKTRMLLFARFAADGKAEYDERPETFDFLGFTHVCGTDRRGKFAVVRSRAEKQSQVSGAHEGVALGSSALEATRPAAAVDDDAAGFLSVLRTTPLQTETRRDPARGSVAVDPRTAPTQPAAPAVLVLSPEVRGSSCRTQETRHATV